MTLDDFIKFKNYDFPNRPKNYKRKANKNGKNKILKQNQRRTRTKIKKNENCVKLSNHILSLSSHRRNVRSTRNKSLDEKLLFGKTCHNIQYKKEKVTRSCDHNCSELHKGSYLELCTKPQDQCRGKYMATEAIIHHVSFIEKNTSDQDQTKNYIENQQKLKSHKRLSFQSSKFGPTARTT